MANESWTAFQHLLAVLRERYECQRRERVNSRVVFILGAGASLWSLMPLWRAVKEAVLDAALKGFSNFLKEACIRLETTLGTDCRDVDDHIRRKHLLERATTDQLCAVACSIELCRERVLECLRELFSGPPGSQAGLPPQLGYELIAHMLKHGFADHVVTFNFDDLLTTAMHNEVGPNEFELIASHHALRPSDGPLDAGLPRIIQLHGSVRSESTLRFTVESTGVLTQPTKRVLLDTLFPDDRSVHVISLGYSWNDLDLCNWLEPLSRRLASLTVVTRNKRDLSDRILEGSWNPNFLETDALAATGELSIDQLLWAIWNELSDSIKPAPPPAARHLILGYLFGPSVMAGGKADVHDPNNKHNGDRRFAAEVALHVIKCQGMVTASMMARDLRIQRYRRHVTPTAFDHIIKRVLRPGSYPEVRETLFSQARMTSEFVRLFHDLNLKVGDVLEPVACSETEQLGLRRRDGTDFLEELVAHIQNSPEIEIVRSGDPRTQWLFNHAEPLASFPLFESRTERVIRSDWTHLLVVAETGEWITRDAFKGSLPTSKAGKRRLLMINASLPSEEDWKRKPLIDQSLDEAFDALRTDQKIDVTRSWMPWWQHNRHLTLAYDARTRSFLGAIFFQRPNKVSRISPVFTEDGADCGEVLVTFLTYVRRTLERQVFEQTMDIDPNIRTSKIEAGFVENTLAVIEGLLDRDPRLKALGNVIENLAGKDLEA